MFFKIDYFGIISIYSVLIFVLFVVSIYLRIYIFDEN